MSSRRTDGAVAQGRTHHDLRSRRREPDAADGRPHGRGQRRDVGAEPGDGEVDRVGLHRRHDLVAQRLARRVGALPRLEHRQQLHRAEGIGERVVDLEDVRRSAGPLSSTEPLEEHALPQRAGAVEGSQRDLGGVDEHLLAARDLLAAQVVGEVEGRVVGPRRCGGRHDRLDDALAQAAYEPGAPLGRGDEAVPVGRPVQVDHDGRGRGLHRVALGTPQQRLHGRQLGRGGPPGRAGPALDVLVADVAHVGVPAALFGGAERRRRRAWGDFILATSRGSPRTSCAARRSARSCRPRSSRSRAPARTRPRRRG